MKLIKINSETYINPWLVTGIFIDSDVSDRKTGEARFCVAIAFDTQPQYVAYQLPKHEAEAMLDWIAA